MLIYDQTTQTWLREQGIILPPCRDLPDLFIKGGEKRAVKPIGQLRGLPGNMGLISMKEKAPALQEGRGEMPVIDFSRISLLRANKFSPMPQAKR